MPKFCAHLGYLFTEMPFDERVAAAAKAGFAAVEHPSPYAIGIDTFDALCRRHGLPVAQIAAPVGTSALDSKGFACRKGQGDAFRTSVLAGIDAAKRLDAGLLHVMPGLIGDGVERAELTAGYLDNMTWAADTCAAQGVRMIIEAISDETIPGFFVNYPMFALELIAAIGRPNVAMLFDTYHAAVKGIDPVEFVETHVDAIAHVQIADHPGRHEPGTGKLDFRAFFARLDDLGFKGVVGCEYKPAEHTLAGLNWMESYCHA